MHDVACEFARAVVRSKDAQKQLARTSLKIQKGGYKTQTTRDKGKLNLYSYSKRMWGLPVSMLHQQAT